jgi:hypothetical protein
MAALLLRRLMRQIFCSEIWALFLYVGRKYSYSPYYPSFIPEFCQVCIMSDYLSIYKLLYHLGNILGILPGEGRAVELDVGAAEVLWLVVLTMQHHMQIFIHLLRRFPERSPPPSHSATPFLFVRRIKLRSSFPAHLARKLACVDADWSLVYCR